MNEIPPDQILDVAIVGGGVSGLYSAWRLMREGGPRPRVTVFEGSHRLGGRLLSVTPPGMPGTRCELGGMRYMSRHVLVDQLVKHFGLRTEPMGVAQPANIAYLRGRQFRLAQLETPQALPYTLTDAERYVLTQAGGDLLLFALQQIAPNCLTLPYDTLLQALRTAKFGGTPLHRQGFWNVLARVLSPDAYWLARTTGGYDCLLSNWNAADAVAFILADFGADAAYHRFPDGYEALPQRLASEFQGAGGAIRCASRLRSFDTGTLPDGTEGTILRFADGQIVQARKLVLAMPRRSIELLEATGSVLGPEQAQVRALIDSVEPIPLFKLFLCYDEPWWQSVGVTTGRSVTDLPIRQCYYWAVDKDAAGQDGKACLLASYDDDVSVTFWEGLRKTTAQTPLWGGASPPSSPQVAGNWSDYRAPAALAEEVHRQLMQMHGVSYAPKPYAAVYLDWTQDPYGGGVHFWRIEAESWNVIPAMVNPRPGLPVYVCGEAYSREQGWVEGALQTAELMLQKHFGLLPAACAGAASAPERAKPAPTLTDRLEPAAQP